MIEVCLSLTNDTKHLSDISFANILAQSAALFIS